jgi:hypothetical protein
VATEQQPALAPRCADDADADERPLQVEYAVTVAGGEHGRRLAPLQAAAILDVLTWFRGNATHEPQRRPSIRRAAARGGATSP